MAWIHVQGKLVNDTSTSTPFTVSYNSNVTSGNLLIAIARWDDHALGRTITVSTAEEGTWTTVIAKYSSNNSGNQGFYVACAVAASSGPRTVSYNWNLDTNAYRDLIILEYSGNNTSSPFDVSARDSAATTSTALSSGATAALSTTAELAIGIGCAWDTSVTWGTVTGWSLQEHSTAIAVYDQTTPSSSAVTFSVTLGSPDQWVAAVATFKPPPAAATVDQEGFRARNDDGSETTATWKAAQDTNSNSAIGANVRLRILLNATNDPASKRFMLNYRKVGDTDWKTVQ